MDEFEDDEAEDDEYEEDEADEAADTDDEPQDIAMAYESNTKGVRWRRRTMQQQRCELAQEKAIEKAADKATRGENPVENVKALLRHHHRSVAAGWRKALDRTTSHRVGKLAFCKALRELGCKEDYNVVWVDLGGKRGHITLADLDDAAAQILSAFYRGFLEKINSRIHTLVEDVDSLRIDCKAFLEKCKLIKNTLQLEDVFKALCLDIPYVTAADLEWLEQYCERGHKPEPTKSAEDQAREEKRQEALDKAAQRKVLKDFRMMCHHKFGGVIGAWRERIDPQGRGRLPREDLKKGVSRLGFTGDFDDLWDALAGDSYVVTIDDVEPAGIEALNSFKNSCVKRFGSMTSAFRALSAKDMPLVTRDEFIRWCKDIRSDHGSDKLLWRYLDEQNLGKILIDAIDSEAAEEAFDKESLEAAAESQSTLEPLPKKAPPITLVEREEKKLAEKPPRASEEARNMHQALLDMFNRKFGSAVRAWKIGLDTKGAGKLSKDDFFLGCSVLGYRGNLNDVWSLLGLKETSHIRLRDLDASTGEDVRQFREKCIDRFGTVHDALQKVSKTKKSKGNARVNEEQFYQLCKIMDVTCPYKKLWTHLDPTRRGFVSTKSVGWLTNIPDTDEKALARNLCQMVEQQKARRDKRQIELAAATCRTAKEQQRKLDEHRQSKEAQKEVMKQRDKLLKTLSVDYKAIGRGWIIAMDPDRLGELTLDDFYTGLERLGMLSADANDDELTRAEDLFKLFDPEATQVITLDRFDRGLTTEALSDLRHHLVERYGSLLMAFAPHIHRNLAKNGSIANEDDEEELDEEESQALTSISVDAFRFMCQEAKFTSAIHRLVMFLDPYETGKIDLSLIDEDVASEALVLSRKEFKKLERYWKRRERRLPHMIREEVRVGVACGTAARDNIRDTRDGVKALKEFKKRCVSKYGSLATAWQELINLDGEEDVVGFDAFAEACNQLNMEDRADVAWAALDLKDDTLSLRTLDENIHKDLIDFNSRIMERFGSIDNAINETDTDDTFEMNYELFCRLCFECQYRRNMRRLFEYFGGAYKDKKSVVSFLNIDAEAVERVKNKRQEDEERKLLERGGVPKHGKLKKKKKMSKGSDEAAGEDDEQEDSQSDSQGGTRRRSGNVVPQRAGEDPAVLFRAFLCRRFGVIRRAWRVIDVHKQAALTKPEFSSACRVVGFGGNAGNVWNACGCKELLSLKDLDPDGWQLLARFRKLFNKKKGNLDNLFEEKASLDYDSFCDICKKIELPKPWETLFDILDIRCHGVIKWDDVKFLEEDFDWSRGVPLRKCAVPLGDTRSNQLPSRVTGMGPLCTAMKPRRVNYSMTNSLPNLSLGLRPNWNDRHNIIDHLGNKTENVLYISKYVNVVDEIRISRRVAKEIRRLPTRKMLEDNISLPASP